MRKKISELLGVTAAAVSQHLLKLKQAGFVRSERNGYWIPYAIDEKTMNDCRQALTEICTCGCRDEEYFRDNESCSSDLVALKKYKRELESELRSVRDRIKALEVDGQ